MSLWLANIDPSGKTHVPTASPPPASRDLTDTHPKTVSDLKNRREPFAGRSFEGLTATPGYHPVWAGPRASMVDRTGASRKCPRSQAHPAPPGEPTGQPL